MMASEDDQRSGPVSVSISAGSSDAAATTGSNVLKSKPIKKFGDADDYDTEAHQRKQERDSAFFLAIEQDDAQQQQQIPSSALPPTVEEEEDDDHWNDVSEDREHSVTRKTLTERKRLQEQQKLRQAASAAASIANPLAATGGAAASAVALLQAKILAQTQAINESLKLKQQQQQQSAPESTAPLANASEAVSAVDKKEQLRQLVERIPTDSQKLLQQPIAWSLLHQQRVIELQLREWIVKKLVEYLGVEEESLTSFILEKLQQPNGVTPQELQEELVMVLESDAEGFVVKLWKMLLVFSLKCQHGL
jgi:RNA-binding protein 25